jgi:hypothetical protein
MVHRLVPSDRVESKALYGRHGQKIGTIERLTQRPIGSRRAMHSTGATAPRCIGIRSIGQCSRYRYRGKGGPAGLGAHSGLLPWP